MNKPIARNIDAPANILGLAPLEIAALGVLYAILSTVLRGVPFAALLSLAGVGILAATILTQNRVSPPMHGVFALLRLHRRGVTPVMHELERE